MPRVRRRVFGISAPERAPPAVLLLRAARQERAENGSAGKSFAAAFAAYVLSTPRVSARRRRHAQRARQRDRVDVRGVSPDVSPSRAAVQQGGRDDRVERSPGFGFGFRGFFFGARVRRPFSRLGPFSRRSVSGTLDAFLDAFFRFFHAGRARAFEEFRRGVETSRVSRPEAPRAGRRRVVWTISAEPGHGFVRARRRRRGERHRDSAPVRRARGTRHDRRRRVRDGCCRALNALDALDVRTISLLGVLRAEKGVPAVPVGVAGSVHRQLQRAPRRGGRAGSSDRVSMTRLRGLVIRARRIDLSTSRWRARAIRRGGALRGARLARARRPRRRRRSARAPSGRARRRGAA